MLKATDKIGIAALTQRSKSTIGHGLPAAGLPQRIIHLTSQFGQQLIGCLRHIREELVNITRYEQAYFHQHNILLN
jgi:hypothetical protein